MKVKDCTIFSFLNEWKNYGITVIEYRKANFVKRRHNDISYKTFLDIYAEYELTDFSIHDFDKTYKRIEACVKKGEE